MPMKSFLLMACLLATAGAETTALASKARVWLKVPEGMPPLARVICPGGEVTDSHWEADASLRARQMDIHFPVTWWRWNEARISFTPAHSGPLEIRLMGPWSPDENGSMPRRYVLWDDIRAEGAEIINGGFEERSDGKPSAWGSPWAPAEDGSPVLSGKHAASTWLNNPLVQTIRVTEGQPVTLVLHARAVEPPGFVGPRRLPVGTPAHQAAAAIKRGMNLGNGWDAPPSSGWGLRFTPEDIDRIAAEGFDHIRMPAALAQRMKGGKLDPAFFAEIEPIMRRALQKKMRILLDWHSYDALMKEPAGRRAAFVAGWEEIARHFQSWPDALWFELVNEPSGGMEGNTLNAIYRETIAAIRKSNPHRILVCSPGGWGSARELGALRLPDDDDRIVVTFHCYDPMPFTHQGAGWVGMEKLKGIVYPGPPPSPVSLPPSLAGDGWLPAFLRDYNTLPPATNPCGPSAPRRALDLAADWSREFGRPVHLGEFGAYQTADEASRARYLRDVHTLAAERNIPWCMWEWKAGFGYWDAEKQRPRFRAALMGEGSNK